MRKLILVPLVVILAGCSSNVGQTVMEDFGLRERSDDYVSGEDRVFQSMRTVGETELKRLNMEGRRGEILYEDADNLQGKYYRQVKRYDRAYPVDATPEGRRSNRVVQGYTGIIEYSYEIYEGRRESNRTTAEATEAEIPTGQRGRDRFRYHFGTSGTWDGNQGEPMR